MFSTTPPGETPVSKSSVRSLPFFSTRTSAEKPGSATSASGTPAGTSDVATRGAPPASAFGQLRRVTGSLSRISGSVTLSIRIVTRTLSTGSSSITCGTAATLTVQACDQEKPKSGGRMTTTAAAHSAKTGR